MATGQKGTKSNPYTMAEYESMANAGTWEGGYVMDDSGEAVYMMKEVTVEGSGSDLGSETGSVPESQFEFSDGSYTPHNPEDDDDDDGDDENGGIGGGPDGGNDMGDEGWHHGGGGHQGENTENTEKNQALNLVDQFIINTNSTTVYPNINKNGFAAKLKEQINNPSLVQQGDNGTCGFAAICKYLAETMPKKYAEMAISLYKTGRYDDWGIRVCEKSKTGTDEQAENLNTTSLDCIVQGAFRNTYNNIPPTYNPFINNSGWSSMTWPSEINSFFEKKLNKECKCSTYPYPKNCRKKLSDIDYDNKFVIALIHSNYPSSLDFGSSITDKPDHYVQIMGIDKNESVEYWQWGESYNSNTYNCWGIYIIDR